MNKLIFSLFVFVFFSLPVQSNEIDSLLKVLDMTIAGNKTFMQDKETRIESLRKLFGKKLATPEEMYTLNSLMYREFVKYNFDSTLRYITLNLNLAQKLQKKEWLLETKFHLARLLTASGMYKESLDVLDTIHAEQLPSEQKKDYYSCFQELYTELGLYSVLPENSEKFWNISHAYRDTLLGILDPNSNDYLILYESKMLQEGKTEEALRINSLLLSRIQMNSPEYALFTFQRAITYRALGNKEMEKKYLILSAVSDISSAVKDNVSLTLLAIILFNEKDIDRAYRYINFSLEDAYFYNARLRFVEISRILPLIRDAYQLKSSKQKKKLLLYLMVITIMASSLILALSLMYLQMNRLGKARRDLQQVNNKLTSLSEDLVKTNAQLTKINRELSESNHIKEEYIAFYLNMCSAYISKLDEFRKNVNRKIVSGQVESLLQETKSNNLIEKEVAELFVNFDNIFLHLFPDFVEQFNELLSKENRIMLKPDELLNTELRIFALIRLGITDSGKIASFLRCSVHTIYNYRTRIRNKAIVPKDEFESYVRLIGISNQHVR
ncbi:MAG TPA: DUF6377 domain-containing protein [Bacteroidales bacterium]|nr:DUF6377 domain-containing protein [Bacteroidales bacterium]